MNLFELRGTEIFSDSKINDINTIKSKIENRLADLNARIAKENNGISFSRRKLYSQLGTLITKSESLGFMREGEIDVNKESHTLKISWTVKLDSLYFFALCCSIVVGTVISLYANTETVISLCIGIVLFLMFVFIGIVLIKIQMDDLINSSVYRNLYGRMLPSTAFLRYASLLRKHATQGSVILRILNVRSLKRNGKG